MPVANAGASFVAHCACTWRETYAYRRDAQAALGTHGETCGTGRREAAEGPQTRSAAPRTPEQAPEVAGEGRDAETATGAES